MKKLSIDWAKTKESAKTILKKIGRKNLVVFLAIVVIGAAVYMNYLLFSDPIDAIGYGENNMEDTYGGAALDEDMPKQVVEENDAYFSTTVLSRQKARDEALEVLQTVVDSGEALEETKTQAFADISQIAKDIESEANIETLIEAKGFKECVAVVSGGNANIVVKSDGLMPNEIAQINEIVYEQSGILPVNVRIVERAY